jgi:hypothetical protein
MGQEIGQPHESNLLRQSPDNHVRLMHFVVREEGADAHNAFMRHEKALRFKKKRSARRQIPFSMSFRDRGEFWIRSGPAQHVAVYGDQSLFWMDLDSMDGGQIKRRRSRWPKDARDLVNEYLGTKDESDDDPSRGASRFRVLVTRLHELTGYPRGTCLYFARQLGVKDKRQYAEWTKVEQQKLLDLIVLHPPQEVAKVLRRSTSSIRGMLYRLKATAQMGREWFTVYTLAEALHIRVQEVQRWIALGWLKSRIVETGRLKKHIIDPDDFAEFCKRHRREVVGRRLNVDRLDFVHNFVFPPSHVELLPAREQGYKTARKLAAAQKMVREETGAAKTGFKFEPDCDRLGSSGDQEDSAADIA